MQPQQAAETFQQGFDGDGNVVQRSLTVYSVLTGRFDTEDQVRNYYDAASRLRAVQHYNFLPDSTNHGTFDEYEYDALGRRVVVLSHRRESMPACTQWANCVTVNAMCQTVACNSSLTRYMWNGSETLVEDRQPFGIASYGPDDGYVTYVHGLELDRPVGVIDSRVSGNLRVPHPTWRGQYESSSDATGAGADCTLTTNNCTLVAWNATSSMYKVSSPSDANASVTYTWVGGLLMDQQDATGLLYRRNRYYDPMSGRFTQEDPIGLAGGLNVYGFAGGDPVNFADPFGLCPGLPKCGFWGNLLAGVQAGADIADPGEGVNKASWGYKIGFALGDLASTFNDLSLGDPNGYLDPNAAQSIQNDPEVQNTQQRIADNQPKYRQDGQVFENRQNRLPQQARGYYTEWTVDTPGAQNRAKRRIVAGAQGEQYYTDDHYLTFTQIRPASPPPPTKQ